MFRNRAVFKQMGWFSHSGSCRPPLLALLVTNFNKSSRRSLESDDGNQCLRKQVMYKKTVLRYNFQNKNEREKE